MKKADFWTIVEGAAAKSRGKRERMLAALDEELTLRGAAAIKAFQDELDARMNEAMTWALWGAAYLLEDGCSDDGFEYFRAFLIANGREVFEAAVADPESLATAKLKFANDGAMEFEELLYVPAKAYERLTGASDIPGRVQRRTEPKGKQWDEDELTELLPRLAKKVSRRRIKCPLEVGQVIRVPMANHPESNECVYFKVIGLATSPDEKRLVVIMLLDERTSEASRVADWSRVGRRRLRSGDYYSPNVWVEAAVAAGWDDPDWYYRKTVEVVGTAAVTKAEAALAADAAKSRVSVCWGEVEEGGLASFDETEWPTPEEAGAALLAMTADEVRESIEKLARKYGGVGRRHASIVREAYSSIRSINPAHIDLNRALALTELGERVMPYNRGVWIARGTALYALGRVEEAEAAWKRAIETSPPRHKKGVAEIIAETRAQHDAGRKKK